MGSGRSVADTNWWSMWWHSVIICSKTQKAEAIYLLMQLSMKVSWSPVALSLGVAADGLSQYGPLCFSVP